MRYFEFRVDFCTHDRHQHQHQHHHHIILISVIISVIIIVQYYHLLCLSASHTQVHWVVCAGCVIVSTDHVADHVLCYFGRCGLDVSDDI